MIILILGLFYILTAFYTIHKLDPHKQWMIGKLRPWRHNLAVVLSWSIIVVAVLVLI